ncbi:hypothetical protein DFH29DRAFT_320856 [Suillus ampliporus]|nr:hypothetical protein DFH29DRAFT_320856 [Suillus ampliporus]
MSLLFQRLSLTFLRAIVVESLACEPTPSIRSVLQVSSLKLTVVLVSCNNPPRVQLCSRAATPCGSSSFRSGICRAKQRTRVWQMDHDYDHHHHLLSSRSTTAYCHSVTSCSILSRRNFLIISWSWDIATCGVICQRSSSVRHLGALNHTSPALPFR